MISLSKIVSGEATVSKHLTYDGDDAFIPEKLVKFSKKLTPIVVWNVTRRCNLRCIHCYASASDRVEDELTTEQCMEVVEKLSKFNVPMILFSGGEPLLRKDLIDIAEKAKKRGIKCVLSTNGTLIDKDVADDLRVFDYVGVSLDGMRAINDRFRGVRGAFARAIEGLRNVADTGVLTGIRFTVTKHNLSDVGKVIALLREMEIPRFCLYHLVPAGRAEFRDDIGNDERRKLVDFLLEEAGKEGVEIMTVDNPADGVYTYLKIGDERILEFLKYRGGDSSGSRLACIDNRGFVHPNQFWWDYTVGNVLEAEFEDIWLGNDPLLEKLRSKTEYLKGKCGECRYKHVCGGFRVRALRYGDLWGEDPSCYLKRDEIV